MAVDKEIPPGSWVLEAGKPEICIHTWLASSDNFMVEDKKEATGKEAKPQEQPYFINSQSAGNWSSLWQVRTKLCIALTYLFGGLGLTSQYCLNKELTYKSAGGDN